LLYCSFHLCLAALSLSLSIINLEWPALFFSFNFEGRRNLVMSLPIINVVLPHAGLGNLSAIFLFPLLMYYLKLGVTGAAISTVVSQYVSICSLSINTVLQIHFSDKFLTIISLNISCSRYLVTFLMVWQLNKRVILLPPKVGELQFGVYMKSGEFFP